MSVQVTRGRPPRELFVAALTLVSLLEGGSVEATVLDRELLRRGMSERTIRRARQTLGVVAEQRDRRWWLRLPGEPLVTRNVMTFPTPWDTVDSHAARHRNRVREAA